MQRDEKQALHDDNQSRYNSITMISLEVFTQCGECHRVNSETKAQTKTYVSITTALPASMAPDQRNAPALIPSEETSVSRVSRGRTHGKRGTKMWPGSDGNSCAGIKTHTLMALMCAIIVNGNLRYSITGTVYAVSELWNRGGCN